MKVLSSIKKLNKSYSLVIIPYTNDNVRRLSLKAPFKKLIITLLVLSTVAASVYVINNQRKAGSEPVAIKEVSREELQQQIETLTELVNQQNKSLNLSNNQLDNMKSENAAAKSKIEEFTKMYSELTDNYISKTSRGSAATKNSSRALLDLTKLSDIVQELNSSFDSDNQVTAELLTSNKKLEKYIDAIPTLVPAVGKISSPFGMRNHPIKRVYKAHEGVDITSDKGDPIYAAASGVVEFAGYSQGYGYNVKIDHKNGYRTVYGHSSKLLVKEGDIVKKGQKIALVGSTGVSTGPHLHFEIRIGNTPVDPTEYIDFSTTN